MRICRIFFLAVWVKDSVNCVLYLSYQLLSYTFYNLHVIRILIKKIVIVRLQQFTSNSITEYSDWFQNKKFLTFLQ